MNPLNWIGSLFVYRSPDPLDGYRTFLRFKTNRELQKIAGTTGHYSKTILINMIIDGHR
jgi:hypothetical protein